MRADRVRVARFEIQILVYCWLCNLKFSTPSLRFEHRFGTTWPTATACSSRKAACAWKWWLRLQLLRLSCRRWRTGRSLRLSRSRELFCQLRPTLPTHSYSQNCHRMQTSRATTVGGRGDSRIPRFMYRAATSSRW